MIDVFKIYFKSLRYTTRNLTEAWKTPNSWDSSINSRNGCEPLPTSKMKRFLSLVADFPFTSREYNSQHLPMTTSETEKWCFWQL